MRKIKSGIYGLNLLLDGGINEKSTTVVIGGSGAGKTTFALQYIIHGLQRGQDGIFISLDENHEQIVKEAVEMGWTEINEYIKSDKLVFIDASGREFSTFIKKELPAFVSDWKGANARIVIDPLTPVMWSVKDPYEQRELIGFCLKEIRKIGTVVATIEEHGVSSKLSCPEIVIPMYLADSIIHLDYNPLTSPVTRLLRVIKCRNSRHAEGAFPYRIIKGLGIVVHHQGLFTKHDAHVPQTLSRTLASTKKLPQNVLSKLEKILSELDDRDFREIDSANVIEDIIKEYEP
ncbi:MAG: ATPase domain-containing protein [Thermoplasmata archaeon]